MKLLIYLVKGIQVMNSKLVNTFRNYYYNEYLKFFGAKLSSGHVKFAGPCILQIQKGSDIQIGKNFRVNSGPRVGSDTSLASKITVLKGAKLKIGNHCGIANTVLWCRNHIELGDYANIGAGCFVMDSNFHSTDWRIRMTLDDSKNVAKAPVVIKPHAFIGAQCIICKGVTIGEHSMVAAGSVVVKDIPDNELWGGNPAKFIKRLE